MFYGVARSLFRGVFKTFCRWQISGTENIPAEGPVLLCCNHISNLDPMVMGSGFTHRMIHLMAKESLFKVPVLRWIVRDFGAYPVKRGAGDRAAIRATLQMLSEGKMIGIFPEGTRSKTGELGEGHTGAAMFALRSGATVVPCAIIGPYKFLTHPLKTVYGRPLDLSKYAGEKHTAEQLREVTDLIMNAIRELIEEHSNRME